MPSRSAKWYPYGATLDDDPIILADGSRTAPFLAGATGLKAPTVTLLTSSSPGIRGLRFRQSVARPNMAVVPVWLEAESSGDLRAKCDDLIAALAPDDGPGMLELAADLGTNAGDVRWCSAVYAGGLEGDEAPTVSGPLWWHATIKFQLLDLWHSPDFVSASWAGFTSTPTFPIAWPLTFAPYGVQLTKLLDLTGNVGSYGTYTLAGPWSRVRFANDRTLQCWELQRELSSETVVVNTTPGASNPVVNVAGENRYGLLTLRDFFAISPHFPTRPCDTISVQVDGATGTTQFDLEVLPTWASAP